MVLITKEIGSKVVLTGDRDLLASRVGINSPVLKDLLAELDHPQQLCSISQATNQISVKPGIGSNIPVYKRCSRIL